MTVKIVILYESSVQISTSVEELNNALNRDRTELVSQTVVPNSTSEITASPKVHE